jgi:quinolinate synthase
MSTTLQRILAVKRDLGQDLVILAHHYQRKEIVEVGDIIGDSYQLARFAAANEARRIVFCGVHFMAEAARILARPGQQVYMPDPRAGCPMADMADARDTLRALAQLEALLGGEKRIIPVTYVNSNADVKAVVGNAGGIVCTSANAAKALRWARERGDLIFFLPDEFLGTNTANSLGYGPIARWNPHEPDGGLTAATAGIAKVVVWQGYCHVHTYFTPAMVEAARTRYPGCKVVVHPECKPDVVAAADGSGSTTYLVDEVKATAATETIVVGTEVNLVLRLADQFPDRRVVPLDYSLCPNMYRTTPEKLADLLETFDPAREIKVMDEVAKGARLALQRMLDL